MKTVYIIFLLGCFSISCSRDDNPSFNKESVRGEWLVQAIHMDKNYYKPNTFFMEFSDDSLYYKNMDEEKALGKRKLTFSKDSLKIDTVQFPIRKFKVIDNNLHFIKSIASKIISTESLDIKKVKNILWSHPWKTNKGVFVFENEGGKMKFIPSQKEGYNKYCYEIRSYKDAVFLLKKGNQISCDRDYQFIEQIISISDEKIVTFGFEDDTFKRIIYQNTEIPETTTATEFQLCNLYLNKNNPRDRYYYHGTEYNGGLYHIRKIINEKYKVPENSKESGIFQVRFVVNCEGKAGLFEYQAFDYDYKLKTFSSAISDQIFDITKGLQDWIPGVHPKTNQAIDTYIYLSFRIKDGKITRIYP